MNGWPGQQAASRPRSCGSVSWSSPGEGPSLQGVEPSRPLATCCSFPFLGCHVGPTRVSQAGGSFQAWGGPHRRRVPSHMEGKGEKRGMSQLRKAREKDVFSFHRKGWLFQQRGSVDCRWPTVQPPSGAEQLRAPPNPPRPAPGHRGAGWWWTSHVLGRELFCRFSVTSVEGAGRLVEAQWMAAILRIFCCSYIVAVDLGFHEQFGKRVCFGQGSSSGEATHLCGERYRIFSVSANLGCCNRNTVRRAAYTTGGYFLTALEPGILRSGSGRAGF